MANQSKKGEQKDSKRLTERRDVKAYMKYSGMAFQIVVYILVGVLLGKQIDRWLETQKPYFTLLLSILFLAAYFIKLVRDLSHKD